MSKELWTTHASRGEKHRIVHIEYINGWPGCVTTEMHWDHRRKPWFNPSKDQPTGTCRQDFSFSYSKRLETLCWHNTGGGGDPLSISMGQLVDPSKPIQIWTAPDVVLTKWAGRDQPYQPIKGDADLLARGYQRIALPLVLTYGFGRRPTLDPFKAGDGDCGNLIYCERCGEDCPDSAMCEHLGWCDECEDWIYVDTHARQDDPEKRRSVHLENLELA